MSSPPRNGNLIVSGTSIFTRHGVNVDVPLDQLHRLTYLEYGGERSILDGVSRGIGGVRRRPNTSGLAIAVQIMDQADDSPERYVARKKPAGRIEYSEENASHIP